MAVFHHDRVTPIIPLKLVNKQEQAVQVWSGPYQADFLLLGQLISEGRSVELKMKITVNGPPCTCTYQFLEHEFCLFILIWTATEPCGGPFHVMNYEEVNGIIEPLPLGPWPGYPDHACAADFVLRMSTSLLHLELNFAKKVGQLGASNRNQVVWPWCWLMYHVLQSKSRHLVHVHFMFRYLWHLNFAVMLKAQY